MGWTLTGDRRALELVPDTEPGSGTVDVYLDDKRVWSVGMRPANRRGRIVLRWPAALRPYLSGDADVSVRDSANGTVLARGDVAFGGTGRVSVRDAQGRWLAMNKWNRLGPSFEGDDTGIQQRLLAASADLAELLQREGYTLYIVGGTLLGAIRNGHLLPHDDDMDFAFLCREDNPLDIGLVSYRMERSLVAAGYTVVRHSLTHLQVTFFTKTGVTDYYIDIFTGFFEGEALYSQPFAVRGELHPEDLEPVGSMTIDGVELPSPANPDAWLSLAYGPDWRTPDPSFRFKPPRSTVRRFENWFGVFNRGRVYWEKRYGELIEPEPSHEGEVEARRFLAQVPAGAPIVDLGCGDGRLTELLARDGREVIGVDYSHEALRLARQREGRADYRYLNLNDRHALLEFGADLVESGKPWWFFSHDTIHAIPRLGRENVFLFLRLVLEPGAAAVFTFPTDLGKSYRRGNPDTWHFPLDWLDDEAGAQELGVEILGRGWTRTSIGLRRSAAAKITRSARTVNEGADFL